MLILMIKTASPARAYVPPRRQKRGGSSGGSPGPRAYTCLRGLFARWIDTEKNGVLHAKRMMDCFDLAAGRAGATREV